MNSNPLFMSGFFEEVKRRKVYRVAVAYVIAAGGIIQLASASFPAWELPNWALRAVILGLLIGFPIALILAWAFDITRQGIKTTPTAAPRPQLRRNVLALIAAGVLISAAAGFFLLPASAHKIDKSVAVLPFESLSDEKENTYFADGVQDDILTNLSKIGDLKVISRTSVMQYRGKTSNIREIGKSLGVGAVLEGSVRRVGNRVRVNVQLIDATNDQHIWANDYDRELNDVFAIQTDLAREIANQLQAKLSPAEKTQMERKPTENGEAYLAFVQAHNLGCSYEDLEKLKQSEQLYERAIQLDPKFALAFARYSQLESWMVHSWEKTAERKEKARQLAQRALEIQPDLAEGHLALGFSYYYGDDNYDAALREFQVAQAGLPNESDAYLAIGAIQRRQGKWSESTANLEKAAELNPKDSWPLQNLAFNYEMQRDFDNANKVVDRALQINPKGFALWETKSKLAIAEKGDLSVAEKALAVVEATATNEEEKLRAVKSRVELYLLKRNFPEVIKMVESIPDERLKVIPGGAVSKYVLLGVAKKALQDEPASRAALLRARELIEPQLKEHPADAGMYGQYGTILACLGDKDGALKAAERATELLPESKDAFDGPGITETVANIHAILGDHDRAIQMLDGLMSRPSLVTVYSLKLNPSWDCLQQDPAFQALLDKHSGKA